MGGHRLPRPDCTPSTVAAVPRATTPTTIARRFAIAGAFTAGLIVAWFAPALTHGSAQAAVRTPGKALVLSLGDRFSVEQAPIGCRVTRISGYGGRVFVDCRRAGPLAGSYGTLLSDRRVMVVRYRDAHTAKVVFEATHAGLASRCR